MIPGGKECVVHELSQNIGDKDTIEQFILYLQQADVYCTVPYYVYKVSVVSSSRSIDYLKANPPPYEVYI